VVAAVWNGAPQLGQKRSEPVFWEPQFIQKAILSSSFPPLDYNAQSKMLDARMVDLNDAEPPPPSKGKRR
jgi:hypothetical protein